MKRRLLDGPTRAEFLARLAACIGPDQVLSDTADMAASLTDWRGRYRGAALAVAQPGTVRAGQAIVVRPGRRGMTVAQAFLAKRAKHIR